MDQLCLILNVLSITPVFTQLYTDQLYSQDEFDNFASMQFPEPENLLSQYDFIIIGGGAAGCTLANRLSEIPKWNILLIEAGVHETLDMDIPAFAPAMQQSDVDWKFLAEKSDNYGSGLQDDRIMVPRGKVLGGSTVLNYMVYTRGNVQDYHHWYEMGNTLWHPDTVLKYFRKFENYSVSTNESSIFGHEGPMHLQNTPYSTDFAEQYMKANSVYGIPLTNINGLNQIGISKLQSYTKDGFRVSANRGYLIPARHRSNLHVKTQCQGSKITFSKMDRPRANGVEIICDDGSVYHVKAEMEVIVSTGSIKSPQLLMLSGIGPANDLEQLGIEVIADLPVGENLMEHIFPIGIVFTVQKPIFPSIPENTMEGFLKHRTGLFSTPGCVEIISYSNPVDGIQTIENLLIEDSFLTNEVFLKCMWKIKPELFQIYEPFMNQTAYTVATMLQKPKSRGNIKLSDTNPMSPPLVNLNILTHPDDIETLVAGIKQNIEIANQKILQDTYAPRLVEAVIPQCKAYKFGSDDYWKCHIRALPAIVYHPSGTCKMGPGDDGSSVVNQFLQVKGVDGLRVIDASIIPEIPAGHISAPTIMIAEHGADLIKLFYGEPIDDLQ